MFYTVCLTKLNLAFTLEASIRAGPAPAIATASTKQYLLGIMMLAIGIICLLGVIVMILHYIMATGIKRPCHIPSLCSIKIRN
jgi:hypothetical protein